MHASLGTFIGTCEAVIASVPHGRETCISLHLYGRNMDSFHIYDVDAGTRRMIDVPHYETR